MIPFKLSSADVQGNPLTASPNWYKKWYIKTAVIRAVLLPEWSRWCAQHPLLTRLQELDTMALTDVSVRQAKATGKPYTLADFDGLSLFVSAAGAKAWHFALHPQARRALRP